MVEGVRTHLVDARRRIPLRHLGDRRLPVVDALAAYVAGSEAARLSLDHAQRRLDTASERGLGAVLRRHGLNEKRKLVCKRCGKEDAWWKVYEQEHMKSMYH